MRHEEFHYNKETKEWKTTIVEDDEDFVFSTTTDFPIERLKQGKNENQTQENQIEKPKEEKTENQPRIKSYYNKFMNKIKILKIFLPSLILFILFRLLNLFSACFYDPDYSYYLDPIFPCKSGFLDITLYHWIILIVILPTLSYFMGKTRKQGEHNKIIYIVNILLNAFFILLIISILLFKQFLDFPFWPYFV